MEAVTPVEDVEWIRIDDGSAVGRVRRAATRLANQLDFSEHRAGEVAIAATEIGTNLFRHADNGAIAVRVRREADTAAVELIGIDSGPGVANLGSLLSDGRSTAGTLGIGLGAIVRLATWFDAQSTPGRGTVMLATFWRGAAPAAPPGIAMLTRAMSGESVCGDACAVRTHDGVTTLVLVDGLGHGPLAAVAASAAVRAFREADPAESPAALLRRFDIALRRTRGAAASVARLDPGARSVVVAGVGNVAVWVDDGERRSGAPGRPGIVGANAKPAREYALPMPADALVVLHSDGLSSKWDLGAYAGLRMRDPHLAAAVLLRDAGIRHDDASVIVAKAS
ncbi:MAG: hypothetical protein QOJ39_2290 [Candidatus Eremiobacteraeota bacterium]|nr:hypothetical protein [Candidatus Eremiobacteraeota bacterium]